MIFILIPYVQRRLQKKDIFILTPSDYNLDFELINIRLELNKKRLLKIVASYFLSNSLF